MRLRLTVATALASLAAAAVILAGPSRPDPRVFFHKGVNFTAEKPDVYSSPRAREMIDRLRDLGVRAIALVPYGFCPRGSSVVRFGGSRVWETDASIEQLAAYAHSRGFKVFLKPQVWVGRGYPGDLEFPSAESRADWFASYRSFLEHYARLATRIHADLFSVGVEFASLSGYEKKWRSLIARARELYPGPLVYCANWGAEFESVAFWDALDYAGLNNYYPLPDDLSMDRVVAAVEAVHRKHRRPVIFAEAGFSSLESPHRQPWDESPRRLSMEDQARCYEAVFRAFYHKPWFHGVYWWKVGSNGFGGPADGSHTPWGKPAIHVISRWYRLGPR